jgi:hypothetical protein
MNQRRPSIDTNTEMHQILSDKSYKNIHNKNDLTSNYNSLETKIYKISAKK